MLNGNHTAGNISGTGTTLLDAGAVLTATSVVQNTLNLNAGAKLTITPIPGGPLNANDIQTVPEPHSFILLLIALAAAAIIRKSQPFSGD